MGMNGVEYVNIELSWRSITKTFIADIKELWILGLDFINKAIYKSVFYFKHNNIIMGCFGFLK
jgi:hypothetical protein